MRQVLNPMHDFFTHNLAHFFYKFDLEVEVYLYDQIGIEEIEAPRTCYSS